MEFMNCVNLLCGAASFSKVNTSDVNLNLPSRLLRGRKLHQRYTQAFSRERVHVTLHS